MQTQHLIIIIAAGLTIGLLLIAYFIRKAVLKAFANLEASHNLAQTEDRYRIKALNQDIIRLNGIRETQGYELQAFQAKALYLQASPFTMADHQTLMDIAHSLRLAHDTWKAIPGTELIQVKAAALVKHAQALAYRTFSNVTAATALNGEPLDTQLIEWLNKNGTFVGEHERSTISFPHDSDTIEYPHLRDALREAYELDTKLRAQELGLDRAEDAA